MTKPEEQMYVMWETVNKSERLAKGFKGGNVSTDGKNIIVGLGKKTNPPKGGRSISIPDYLPDTYTFEIRHYKTSGSGDDTKAVLKPDGKQDYDVKIIQKPLTNTHPHYNHEQAIYIVTKLLATSMGASDGWRWKEPE